MWPGSWARADAAGSHAETSSNRAVRWAARFDVNANGIPDECECLADLSGNGAVDVPDLLLLLATWGLDPGGPPDFDGDGMVAVPDLLQLLAAWGPCQ